MIIYPDCSPLQIPNWLYFITYKHPSIIVGIFFIIFMIIYLKVKFQNHVFG